MKNSTRETTQPIIHSAAGTFLAFRGRETAQPVLCGINQISTRPSSKARGKYLLLFYHQRDLVVLTRVSEGDNCLRSHINKTETHDAMAMITKARLETRQLVSEITSYGRSLLFLRLFLFVSIPEWLVIWLKVQSRLSQRLYP